MNFSESQIRREAWDQLSDLESGEKGYYIFLEDLLYNDNPHESYIKRKEIRSMNLLFPILSTNLVSLELLFNRDFGNGQINRKFISFKHHAIDYYTNKHSSVRFSPAEEIAETGRELGMNPFEVFDELYFLNNWFPILG